MQKRRRIRIRPAGFVLLATVVVLIVLLFRFIFGYLLPETAARISPITPLSSVTASANQTGYTRIERPYSDIYKGDLILVNFDYPCRANQGGQLSSLFESKTSSYQVRDHNVILHKDIIPQFNALMDDFLEAKGKSDIMALSGYRSPEKQEELYQNDLQQTGAEESTQVAKAGYSEHQTGYAMDLSLYTGLGLTLDYTGNGKYAWINQNCVKYGFIVRYAREKQTITKIIDEPWHLRYVGVPHAQLMTQKKLCLEEYIDLLHEYAFDRQHLFVTQEDGSEYEIYYVPAGSDPDATISIPVPEDRDYRISGNNIDGFIVTVLSKI